MNNGGGQGRLTGSNFRPTGRAFRPYIANRQGNRNEPREVHGMPQQHPNVQNRQMDRYPNPFMGGVPNIEGTSNIVPNPMVTFMAPRMLPNNMEGNHEQPPHDEGGPRMRLVDVQNIDISLSLAPLGYDRPRSPSPSPSPSPPPSPPPPSPPPSPPPPPPPPPPPAPPAPPAGLIHPFLPPPGFMYPPFPAPSGFIHPPFPPPGFMYPPFHPPPLFFDPLRPPPGFIYPPFPAPPGPIEPSLPPPPGFIYRPPGIILVPLHPHFDNPLPPPGFFYPPFSSAFHPYLWCQNQQPASSFYNNARAHFIQVENDDSSSDDNNDYGYKNQYDDEGGAYIGGGEDSN